MAASRCPVGCHSLPSPPGRGYVTPRPRLSRRRGTGRSHLWGRRRGPGGCCPAAGAGRRLCPRFLDLEGGREGGGGEPLRREDAGGGSWPGSRGGRRPAPCGRSLRVTPGSVPVAVWRDAAVRGRCRRYRVGGHGSGARRPPPLRSRRSPVLRGATGGAGNRSGSGDALCPETAAERLLTWGARYYMCDYKTVYVSRVSRK